jgi:iron complex transport system permease protein
MNARLGALALVPLVALCIATLVGGTRLDPLAVAAALVHPHSAGDDALIVWTLRLPRACIAACVGGALAGAGFLLQGMLRNPLVDPFLTGVSAGAGAAIAFGIAFGLSGPWLPPLGFAAGIATALLVALLARRAGGVDAERLILAGVSLSALFSALIALALGTIARGGSDAVLAWLSGSLAGRGWPELAWTAPYLVVGALLAAGCVPALNVLRLGAQIAASVGVDVARTQWILLAAATLLTAGAVALAGIVGFVGLIVPHLGRKLVGSDARRALPASILLGAGLVPLADALGRSLAPPLEIPLGVVLAFVGVPVFLYLYLRRPSEARLWGT